MSGPVQDGQGGGQNPPVPILAIPLNINLGNQPIGVPITVKVTGREVNGGYLNVSAVAALNALVTGITPAPPFLVTPYHTVVFQLTFTLNSSGDNASGFTVTSNNGGVPGNVVTINITANGVGSGGGILQLVPVVPGQVPGIWGQVEFGIASSNGNFFVANPGTAPYNVTAVTTDNPDFEVIAPGFLPLTIAPSSQAGPVGVGFIPSILGDESGNITITTTLAPPQNTMVVPCSGTGVAVIPSNILTNATRATLLSGTVELVTFTGTKGAGSVIPIPFFEFNGKAWGKPGYQKTLQRLEVFWENVNTVPIILQLLVTVVTIDSQNKPVITSKAYTLELFDNNTPGDGGDRVSLFDLETTGELIVLQVSVPNPVDQLSLVGFIPWFSDRAEVVPN